jgi:hypothetical protein
MSEFDRQKPQQPTTGTLPAKMRIENYFPSPADPCERLISGLEYCINVEEIEIDEEEILYSVRSNI